MVDVFEPKPFLHIIGIPGLPGTGFSAPDALAIRSDVDALLLRPVITELADVSDVDTTGIANGNVLVWDAGDNEWKVAAPTTITVNDTGSVDLTLAGNVLSAAVIYAGTGSAQTAARSDHTHTVDAGQSTAFNASGYLSSGTRTVVTTTRTLAAGIQYLVRAEFKPQMRGADSGAGYFTMTTTINGNARTSTGGAAGGFWCVQGVPNKESWVHYQTITGTGSAITITGAVTYHSGAGFNIDSGTMDIELFPRR